MLNVEMKEAYGEEAKASIKLEISGLRCKSERTSFDSRAGDSQSATLCAHCRNGKGAIEL